MQFSLSASAATQMLDVQLAGVGTQAVYRAVTATTALGLAQSQSLVTLRNNEAEAEANFDVNLAQLAANWQVAQVTAEHTVLSDSQNGLVAFANTNDGVPWAEYRVAEAAARESFWTSQATRYVDWHRDVGDAHTDYWSDAGSAYAAWASGQIGQDGTLALAVANAGHSAIVQTAGIQETYETDAATAASAYLDALALADLNLRNGTYDQTQHDSAVDLAYDTYADEWTDATTSRRTAATAVGRQYADQLSAADRVHTVMSAGRLAVGSLGSYAGMPRVAGWGVRRG